MTQPALATLTQFRDRLGRDMTDDEEARAQAALEDASALIRTEAGQTWVTGDELAPDVPDVVVAICLRAARRSFDNPSQLSSQVTGNYQQAWVGAGVFLTPDEVTAIQRAVGAGAGLVSVPAVTPWSFWQNEYIDVEGQNEPMPYSEPSGFNPSGL